MLLGPLSLRGVLGRVVGVHVLSWELAALAFLWLCHTIFLPAFLRREALLLHIHVSF